MSRAAYRRITFFVPVAGLALFAFLVGPWPEGRIAPEKAARISAPAGSLEVDPEPFRAGASARDITDLARGRPLAGYVARVLAPSEGIADPLSVRAVVLQTARRRAAIVAVDLLLVTPRLVEETLLRLSSREEAWRREEVYFGAIHTHSGPGGYGDRALESIGLGPFDPAFTARLADRIAAAIREAARNARPAEIAQAAALVDAGLVRNRTLQSGETNRWLDVLGLRESEGGRPIASIAIFSAHATCRPARDRRLSADYPGELRREVESRWGGVAVFLAGAVGGMAAPYHLAPREQLAEVYGRTLGHEASRLLARGAYEPTLLLERCSAEWSLPEPKVRLGAGLCLSPFLARRLLPRQARLAVLRVNGAAMVGVPADMNGALAARLRTTSAEATLLFTSFSGDYIGYVVPEEEYDLASYEPRRMAWYGRSAAAHLAAACQEAAAAVLR